MIGDDDAVIALGESRNPDPAIIAAVERHDGAAMMWTDPPYATGKRQTHHRSGHGYRDSVEQVPDTIDALIAWLPFLRPGGVACIITDHRLSWRVAHAMDQHGWGITAEIIWEFHLGQPRTTWWPVRHNTIGVYVRHGDTPQWDPTAVPRVPRSGPPVVRRKGKTYHYPADRPAGSVWDITPGTAHHTGYPGQKPVDIIAPFVHAHTRPGELIVDPFVGSGSTAVAAITAGRHFAGMDRNPAAVAIARQRLDGR